MRELVIDTSHWDGYVDFEEWREKRDLWGVIIKVGGNEDGLGRYKDPMFEESYRNARAAGLHVGVYYYSVTTDVNNSLQDAKHCLDLIDGKFLDLPVYLDVEDPRQFQLSQRTLTDVIKTFCEEIDSQGYIGGLYTGGSAWFSNMYNDELTQFANWIAWWRGSWPTEAGDIGMWQQGGIRLSDGDIIFDDRAGYTDCDWCAIDYPSRINGEPSQDITPDPEPQTPSTNGSAQDVINAAYGELGYAAYNDPEPGSKYGRWMADLFGEDWLRGPSNEIWWCCMFVSWCLNQGGVEMKGFPSYNTDVTLDSGGRDYEVDPYDVQYGDIVIFNWNWDEATDHIGFATGTYDGYGFPSIEGNISNAVQELYRQMGNVAYVLRPPYNGAIKRDPAPTPQAPKNNRDGGELDIDGIGGWNTIIDWQNQMGTYEDGWISGQYYSNRQYFEAMSNITYEKNGSPLIKAVQRKVGAEVDGIWGRETSMKIQQWLIDHGYNTKVNGDFDKESVMALQYSLNDEAWK